MYGETGTITIRLKIPTIEAINSNAKVQGITRNRYLKELLETAIELEKRKTPAL